MISSTRRLGGHVDGLRDRAGDERLHRAHHAQVAEVVDRALPARRLEGAVEDRQVLVLQVRRALDGVVLVDVLDDVLHLARLVAEPLAARAAPSC